MSIGKFTLTCLVLVVCSCKKDKDRITGGYTNIYIYTSDPTFTPLNAVGGWTYYPAVADAGLKGLIIYRSSQESFFAYDRACTYDTQASCALVEMESSGITAIDSCCNSRFGITDGSVLNGPATQPLIQYRTTFDGSALHIFN